MYVIYLIAQLWLWIFCGVIFTCTAFAQGIHMAHLKIAFSGYISTLSSPFPRRLVHITPKDFWAWCIIRISSRDCFRTIVWIMVNLRLSWSVCVMFKSTAIVCSRLKFQRLLFRLHNSFDGIPRLKTFPKQGGWPKRNMWVAKLK